MSIPAIAAAWFLPFVAIIGIWVSYTDLKYLKIRNLAVYAIALTYLISGFLVLPTDVYLWQLVHLPLMLVFGMLLNAFGLMGAGDAKFLAAAAPMVWLGDIVVLLGVYFAVLLISWICHRIAMNTGLRKLAPDWASWTSGKRFPMGLPLAATLVAYLALGVRYGI